MPIGTGHRSNNYSESKRNDHLDNNRRQEQRNKGIPNKSHPNFREEHKSFSSIFVSNIPWNASVQDLWDICNKWGVVINVYIAAKRSKSGHRFGFVRFINVNDINQLVSNLRTAWMGGFHLFADVAKYGRTYNRPVERSRDGKPSVGSNSQSVSINENVFQSFNSYIIEAVNEAVMSILETIVLIRIGMDMKDVFDRPGGSAIGIMGLQRFNKKLGGRDGKQLVTDMLSEDQCPHGKVFVLNRVFTSCDRVL
ncbi:RNA-directed DNA polymerase, eukaryota, nucleotide-binding alpha-beta plait domain protein [Tanacetum coccineum]